MDLLASCHFFHAEAPLSILAFKLVAISTGFGEAVKVAFFQLSFANDGGDSFYEAGITQGRTDIIGPPGHLGILMPLNATLDTLNTHLVHGPPRTKLPAIAGWSRIATSAFQKLKLGLL